jgi:nitrite reductase (NO-forming)/hydroxylamine reductase
VIGRDAKINMIDLWMEKPDNVAEIRVGLEARSGRDEQVQGLRGQVRHRRQRTGRRSSPS